MIKIADLYFEYSRSSFALEISSLEIVQGEKVAFVGPSGSGKTTLLNLLSGILVPSRGSVEMGDFHVSSMAERTRRNFRITNFGLVFQRFELVEYLKVRDNILLPFLINNSLKLNQEIAQRAESLADQMQLGDKLDRWPESLSQGERQRVAIARALLVEPFWILADEPTGSLDPENKQRIISLLFEQSEKQNSTLIVVTHDTGILDGFDRVIDFADFHAATKNGIEVAK